MFSCEHLNPCPCPPHIEYTLIPSSHTHIHIHNIHLHAHQLATQAGAVEDGDRSSGCAGCPALFKSQELGERRLAAKRKLLSWVGRGDQLCHPTSLLRPKEAAKEEVRKEREDERERERLVLSRGHSVSQPWQAASGRLRRRQWAMGPM